ncbi:MFS transporter [Bacillus velezensis]
MNKQPAVTPRKLLAIAGMGWLFDAMDVGILSFIIAALHTDWNLTPDQMKWIGSVNSIGMATGAFVFGMLADRIGRKKVFMITLLFFSVGSGISAFATGLTVFLILRFLIGMGLGGELPVASTLVSEASAPEKRGRIIVSLESFWAAGWLLAAVISYFVIPSFGWQAAALLTALAAFYALYLRRSLPESPAHQALPQKKAYAGRREVSGRNRISGRRCSLSVVWFCVVFSYYGMFLWSPSVMLMKGYSMIESFEYVLLMTLAQLPGYFSAAWLIEKAGRKTILVIYLLGTAGRRLFLRCRGFIGHARSQRACSLSFFNLGAWGVLYAYTPEQYPAAIRATGSGTTAAVGRIGGIFGPLLVGSLAARNVSFTVIFAVFCAAILIAVITIIILGKETKQTELAQ